MGSNPRLRYCSLGCAEAGAVEMVDCEHCGEEFPERLAEDSIDGEIICPECKDEERDRYDQEYGESWPRDEDEVAWTDY